MRPFLIVNPASANGRTGRRFDEIASLIKSVAGDFEHVFTRGPGDAVRLAREAALGNKELVVAVGGDGTASEVVDGLFENGRPVRSGAVFGFLPLGTGSDLRKTVGCPPDLARAARTLAGPGTRSVDVGWVEFRGRDGAIRTRHFINVADFGVGAVVADAVNRRSKALGGKLSFLIGCAGALLGYRNQPVRYRFDGGDWQEETLTALSVCNGRYYGGGMMVAPQADLSDGLFDITIWKGMGFSDFVLRSRRLYDGTHIGMKNTRTLRAREVEAESLGGAEVLLEVDGEQPGRLPARFKILPGALRIKVGA